MLLEEIGDALSLGALPPLRVVDAGTLPSAFRVSELAVASIGAAGACLARLLANDDPPAVTVDRSLAAHWFERSLYPDGWQVPPVWDPVGGDYPTNDGWIRLHTNAPHHRAAALQVLDATPDRVAVAAAVSAWTADDLEQAVVAAGGAAAAMRSIAEWRGHPQAAAVSGEPLVRQEVLGAAQPLHLPGASTGRPLAGLRVLDLTRVLAGPVATRLLAGWGADVLRIDPPEWDEPGVIAEVLLGKRSARLDLSMAGDRDKFRALMAAAVLRGLAERRRSGRGTRSRLSLARTAQLLIAAGPAPRGQPPPGPPPLSDVVEQTSWGPARRVIPPLDVAGAPLRWDRPAHTLGADPAEWPVA